MPRRRRSSTAPRAAATKGKTTGTAKKVRKNSRGSKKKAIEPKGQAETKKAKMSRKKTEAEKPKASLSKDWSSICLLLLLYTLQGVPMGISAAIPMLLEERKVSMTQQGVFSFCSWPFSLKLLWAPIVDATFNRAWGQRKSWLVPTQLLIGVVMFLSSYRIDSIMEGEADVDMTVLTAVFFSLFFLCATQDVAVDGWALTMLSKENVGYAATCNAAGQSFGSMVSFVGFLLLSRYNLATLGSNMRAWGILFLVTTALVARFKTEKEADDVPGILDTYKEMLAICRLPAVQRFCMILISSKVAFAAVDGSSTLKIQGAGMPKEHVAYMGTLLGIVAVIVPKFVSKYTAGARPFQMFTRLYIPRILFCIGSILTLYFAPSPWPPLFSSESNSFYLTVFVISLAQSIISTAMFVGQVGFFARISDPRIGGTYMTFLNTIANLAFKWPSSLSFFLIGALTERDEEGAIVKDGWYPVAILSACVGFVWIFFASASISKLEAAPLSIWKVNKALYKEKDSEDEETGLLLTEKSRA
jgi:PAT family acetyl-CoA transporter-like MFS transporter 1